MKLLTVSVAAYNVEAYLDKCLSSFADDRLKDALEVLVVDDGSVDRTPEIAVGYEARFPEIFRVIRKKNGGHGSTLNRAMEEARGKYFRAVDGDDWVNTDDLVRLLDALASCDSDLAVDQRTLVHLLTAKETFEPLPDGTPFGREVPLDGFVSEAYFDRYNLHTMSVKTSLLRARGVRVLEKVFYEDFEFVLKATAVCRTVTFFDLDLYRYLIGNSAQSVDHQNYVRRVDHHTAVTREVLRWEKEAEGTLSPALAHYAFRRTCFLVHTHYNVDWIYDEDRAAGAARGRAFRAVLKREYPAVARGTARRYRLVRLLHFFGVNDAKLEKLKRRG